MIEYKGKERPRIRILEGMFGNDAGDVVKLLAEDDNCVYYYDIFRRYCFLNKADEGKDYERLM